MNPLQFVKDSVDHDELCCQLAEEASELAHAALKLRRTQSTQNPTPITYEEALANLLEECADVSLCLVLLGFNSGLNRMKVEGIMDRKIKRWEKRLKGELDSVPNQR